MVFVHLLMKLLKIENLVCVNRDEKCRHFNKTKEIHLILICLSSSSDSGAYLMIKST